MAADFARAYQQFKKPRRGRRRKAPKRPRAAPQKKAVPQVDLAVTAAAFDWRDKIAIRPPGNQGLCYACTSFALAATIEARWLITHPGQAVELSAGFIHTCIGHADETDAKAICNVGCDMYALITLLQTRAYARASPGDYPFTPSACAIASRLGTIGSFDEIADGDAAKSSIVNTGPLAADLYIWQDFFSYTTNRVPAYLPDTSTPGPYLHSVCVVGFDATGWIIKNSMGTSWGDGSGFATVPYGACGMIGAKAPPGNSPREAYSITV
jgi:hypothetical protein